MDESDHTAPVLSWSSCLYHDSWYNHKYHKYLSTWKSAWRPGHPERSSRIFKSPEWLVVSLSNRGDETIISGFFRDPRMPPYMLDRVGLIEAVIFSKHSGSSCWYRYRNNLFHMFLLRRAGELPILTSLSTPYCCSCLGEEIGSQMSYVGIPRWWP